MAKEKLESVIDEVEAEIQRFSSRLKAYRERTSWAVKEAAALRRSALDLKNELTRITQSTIF